MTSPGLAFTPTTSAATPETTTVARRLSAWGGQVLRVFDVLTAGVSRDRLLG